MAGSRAIGQGGPAGSTTRETLNAVKPVFVKSRDLPSKLGSDNAYRVCEMCRACERVGGPQSMEGAQRIGGLWRLYPSNHPTRALLLTKGITLNGCHINLMDTNPFLMRDTGVEIDSTRLTIGDIPLSYSNKEIEDYLLSKGCKPLSALKYELERDEAGQLTHWKTGRRFIFIEMPSSPLPRDVRIGRFQAKLYHKEQKNGSNMECYNCFLKGHQSRDCTNPTKCRACRMEGHKEGDGVCHLTAGSTHFAQAFPDISEDTETTSPETTTTQAPPGTNQQPAEPAPAPTEPVSEGLPEVAEAASETSTLPAIPPAPVSPAPASLPALVACPATQHRASPTPVEETEVSPEPGHTGLAQASGGSSEAETEATEEMELSKEQRKRKKHKGTIMQFLTGGKRSPSPEEQSEKKSRTDA